jgi:hypothetical protein
MKALLLTTVILDLGFWIDYTILAIEYPLPRLKEPGSRI